MTTARRALEALLASITDAVSPAVVGLAGATADEDVPEVVLTPIQLRRVGRSRRHGALLDLELMVEVTTQGPHAIDHLESLLILAETQGLTLAPPGDQPTTPHRAGPPPLGLTIALPVSVTIDEPTGPPVKTVVVDLQPSLDHEESPIPASSPPEGS